MYLVIELIRSTVFPFKSSKFVQEKMHVEKEEWI